MVKVLLILLCVFIALFLLSLIIYFFNLDMKLSSKMSPILEKRYNKIKRDRRI